ncbi:hypothetical protein OQA88_11933 [Cercophora sp. LCS_1]
MDPAGLVSDGNIPHDEGSVSPPPIPSGPSGSQPRKPTVRKRTKTGCLTCRKRRIKCDEGKPTCNNCIKSKRQCEGYNQRLTFKEPLGSFPQGPIFPPAYYHQQAQDALVNAQLAASQAAKSVSAAQGPLAMIAPKPPSVDFTGNLPLQFGHPYPGSVSVAAPLPGHHAMSPSLYSPQHTLPTPPLMVPDALQHPAQTPQTGFSDFYNITPSPQGFDPGQPVGPNSPPARSTRYRGSMSEEELSGVADRMVGGPGSLGSPTSEQGYWQSDDEASMADSEDEPIPDTSLAHLESNDLGVQVARRIESSLDLQGVRLRSFTAVNACNILDTYMPSSANSPLNDPHTAAVFWYFVNMTGPNIFPIIAFSHPALMQAMLALGSLQMAKVQGTPPTAAMKHYHLSLRRVAKNYQSPTKRTQPATLAATLLLGFYEVWNSDHEKWCKHMWGARAIIRELPLREMTREILALKREKRQREMEAQSKHQCDGSCFSLHSGMEAGLDDIDLGLISQLTGQAVNYGESGHVLNGSPEKQARRYTERDIETYESLSDLYWWFCKMDIYQSFLGGTRPFYGTFDHLMLLLGRLAHFTSRDLVRKRKAMANRARSGPGQPPFSSPGGPPGTGPPPGLGPPGTGPPGMRPPGMGSPPSMGPPGTGAASPQTPPMFPGLMPTTGRFVLPEGFSPPRDSSPPRESADDMDLDTITEEALREWEEIRQAFEVFRNSLGPDFAPLGLEHATVPEMTPFGPALMYRTFSIAGIWMNFYMGLIVLYRSQPSMPPFAMAAAGMAAAQTAPWAYEIARISAGLCEDLNNQKAVSMLVGAACIESGFTLFVAGVQFQRLDQRYWLVRRLHAISRLTGWQSARQIADGCESAWIKAAQIGRGPPYESPPDLGPLYSESIWLKPRRLDRRIQDLDGPQDKLVLARTEQAHYALGLMSVEQDMDKLELVAD